MASLTNKKFKRNYVESDSSSDNEADSTFPRFRIIESSSLPIIDLSPFIIEKVISGNLTPTPAKKLKNGTLLVEVEKKKHVDFLLKMTMFNNIPVKTSSSSSSSCRAASTDIPDPLSPLLPIVHRFWQVFRATSHILT